MVDAAGSQVPLICASRLVKKSKSLWYWTSKNSRFGARPTQLPKHRIGARVVVVQSPFFVERGLAILPCPRALVILPRRRLFVSPSGVCAFRRMAISILGLASFRTLLIAIARLASFRALFITALRFPMFLPSSRLRRLPLHGSLLATQRFVVTGRSSMILLRVCFWAAQTTDRLLPACGKLLMLLCPASRSGLAGGALLLLSASRILMRKPRSMSHRLNFLPN